MSEREPTTRAAAANESGADELGAELQTLYAAAYRPLQPSEALRRRVAGITTHHDGQAARRGAWWKMGLAGSRLTAGAAAAICVALLGLLLIRMDRGRSGTHQAPVVVTAPAPEQSAPAPRMARQPAVGERGGSKAVGHASLPPTHGERGASSASLSTHDPSPRVGNHPPRAAKSGEQSRIFDDLAYVNHNLAVPNYPASTVPQDEWTRTEARLRRMVLAQDDFVQISFPRLASAADHQIAQAVESYKREAAIVDARLSRETTCAYKATALSDLCDQLRAESGIRLAAGPSVADEKVTVFCAKLPLREVMRQLSRPFGYTWLRSGKAGEYRYELAQDLKSQLVEEELRNRDRNEALLALDQEMNQYRRYFDLSPDEALAKAKTAPPEEKKLLERFAGTGWGPAQMYFRLSPQQIEQFHSGQTKGISFGTAPGENQHLLPPEMERGTIESMRALRARREGELFLPAGPDDPGGVPLTSLPGLRPVVGLQMRVSDLGQFTLLGTAGFHLSPTPGDPRISGRLDELAVGISPSVRSPRNGIANARLARDPALQPRVSVALTGREVQTVSSGVKGLPARGKDPSSASERKVTSADVLEALHRATGMSVVADYYTRLYSLNAVSLKDRPLFEALNQVCDAMRVRWNKDGKWVQFRSTSFFHDRLKEVPNRLLNRWAASRKESARFTGTPALTLSDILEIAALPDAQLDAQSMAEGAREIHGLAEWDLARNGSLRRHLRFLAQLTGAQRQEALSRAGLSFTKLSLPQQQQFIPMAFGRAAERLRSLEELAKATMRVSYTLPGGFEWRPAGRPGSHLTSGPAHFEPSPASGSSREAALQAAQKLDTRASEAQIVPTELAIMIEYSLGPDSPYRPAGLRVAPGMIFGTSLELKEPR